MLGLFNQIVPKHTKKFIDGHAQFTKGLKKYKKAVEAGSFPNAKNYTKMKPSVLKDISDSC